MKRTAFALIAVSLIAIGCDKMKTSEQPKELTKAELKESNDKVSYAMGLGMGKDFKEMGINLKPEILLKGLKDGLAANPNALMNENEIKETMMAFQQEMMQKSMEKAQKDSVANKAAGDKFLADNKAKPGVTTTASGLQYEVITKGTGTESPKPTDIVKVHYKGTLMNGEEFDSSYSRNEPAVFPLDKVIKGWTEGVSLMKVGDKFKLVVPSELAYGDRGAGKKIGPNQTLIFEVELLEINPKEAAPAVEAKPAGEPKPEAKPADKKG